LSRQAGHVGGCRATPDAKRSGQIDALDAAAFAVLHRAHLMTVPFENLSIHLSEPISLADVDLIEKIVTSRRGGFCYELNGAFGLLLEAMGAEVSRVAASTSASACARFQGRLPASRQLLRLPQVASGEHIDKRH
jgi:arylamine N-acetyltransferase